MRLGACAARGAWLEDQQVSLLFLYGETKGFAAVDDSVTSDLSALAFKLLLESVVSVMEIGGKRIAHVREFIESLGEA